MDIIARNKLVEANLNLVHTCANRFRSRIAGTNLEYDDLFQSGCYGLIKAAQRFDPERGFSFSTYAVPVILGEIRMLFREGGAVKISRSLRDKARDVLRVKEQMTEALGSEPSLQEIAKKMELDCAQVAELLGVYIPPVSIYSTNSDGEDYIIEIPVEFPDEEIINSIALHKELDSFNERDRNLLILRYYKGFTQSRTAQLLGMSQVQVSRREKALLLELRGRLTA